MQKGLKRKARSLRGLETESPTRIFVGKPRGVKGQNMGLPYKKKNGYLSN